MASTWYLTSNLAGTAHQEMSEVDPGTEAFASPVYGWVVGTTATGNFSSADAQTEALATTFGATAQPDGTIVTTAGAGDCWRTTITYRGDFAAGTWTFHACVQANTAAGGTSRGRFRLFRGANADGSGATEITSSASVGSTVTPAVGTTTDSTIGTSLSAFSVADEFLFVQFGWETVTAGSMTTSDANLRVGHAAGLGSRLVGPDLTPVLSGQAWM